VEAGSRRKVSNEDSRFIRFDRNGLVPCHNDYDSLDVTG
jgi:hypothetical protein